MSTETRLEQAALTGTLPVVKEKCYSCMDDDHSWSDPATEDVDTVGITRWRCTCTHCECDGLHLVVNPTDTGTPQHTAVEDPSSGLLQRVLDGLQNL